MKFAYLISVLGGAVLVGGCAQPAVDLAAERAALLAAAEAYSAAGESRDFARMAGFYSSDSLVMPPNAETLEGLAGAREFFASVAETPGLGVQFGELTVEVAASGDLGYTLSDAVISTQGPDGETMTDEDRDLHVWRKENGEWKIALDMWNSEVPPAQPAATSFSARATEDAVTADPDHYTVEFENDRVRIIRIRYGPREKSVMHSHGPHASVMLTDGNFRMSYPDGSSEEFQIARGDAAWVDSDDHLPENLTDEPQEVVLVELKD